MSNTKKKYYHLNSLPGNKTTIIAHLYILRNTHFFRISKNQSTHKFLSDNLSKLIVLKSI